MSCIHRVVTRSVRPGERSLRLVDPGVVYATTREQGLGIIAREEGPPVKEEEASSAASV